MRVRILTASLAVVVGCGALGCKSAPKTAWWSSSKGAKVESTAVAHAAPQLPSEIAKQAEAMNPANPVQITTAPAFAASSASPNASEAASASPALGTYPSTGVKSYVPTTSAAALTTAATNAMPYNPNAVPAAKVASAEKSIADAATNANSMADRYGNLYAQNAEPAAASIASADLGAPNFGSLAGTTAASPTSYAPSNLGDRYSTAGPSGQAAPFDATAPVESQQVQPASALAAADPYRPGGTGTYPGLGTSNAKYEVATRPATSTSSQAAVPNASYPSTGNQYR